MIIVVINKDSGDDGGEKSGQKVRHLLASLITLATAFPDDTKQFMFTHKIECKCT